MFERNRHARRKRVKSPTTTTVSFALTADEAEKLYVHCDELGISVSKFVRNLILEKI